MASKNKTSKNLGNVSEKAQTRMPSDFSVKDDGELSLAQAAVCSMLGQLITGSTQNMTKSDDAKKILGTKNNLFSYIEKMHKIIETESKSYIYDNKGFEKDVKAISTQIKTSSAPVVAAISAMQFSIEDRLQMVMDSIDSIDLGDFSSIDTKDLDIDQFSKLLVYCQSFEDKLKNIADNTSGKNDNNSKSSIGVTITGKGVDVDSLVSFLSMLSEDTSVVGGIKTKIKDLNSVISGKDSDTLQTLYDSIGKLNTFDQKKVKESLVALGDLTYFLNNLKVDGDIEKGLKRLIKVVNQGFSRLVKGLKKASDNIDGDSKQSLNAISTMITSLGTILQNSEKIDDLPEFFRTVRDGLKILIGDRRTNNSIVTLLNKMKLNSDVDKNFDTLNKALGSYAKIDSVVMSLKKLIMLSIRLKLTLYSMDILRQIVKSMNTLPQFKGRDIDSYIDMFNEYTEMINAMPSWKSLLVGLVKPPLLLQSLSLLVALKEPLKVFRVPKGKDLEFAKLASILHEYSKIVSDFPSIKDIIEGSKKSKALSESVIETSGLVDPMQELIDGLAGLDFKKLEREDFKKLYACIGVLNLLDPKKVKRITSSLDMLNKAFMVNAGIGKAMQLGINMLTKEADAIEKFVNKVSSIDESSLDSAIDNMKAVNELVVSSGMILLLGGLAMTYIDPMNVLTFAALTGAFVFTMSVVAKLLSTELIDENVIGNLDNFAKFVFMAGLTLIIGGLAMKLIDPQDLYVFAVTLGGFVVAMSIPIGVMGIVANDKSFNNLEDFAKLIMISGATMIFGGILMHLISNQDLVIFTTTLGAFVAAMGTVAALITRILKEDVDMSSVYEFGKFIALCGGVMALGSMFMRLVKFEDLMMFTGTLMVFTGLMGLVAAGLTHIMGQGSLESMEEFGKLIALSGFTLMIGALFVQIPGMVENVIKFGALLALFVVVVSGAYALASSGGGHMSDAKAFAKLIVMSAAVLLIGAAFMYIDGMWQNTMKFAVVLGVFIIMVGFAYRLAASGEKKNWAAAIGMLGLVAISAATLLIGAHYMMKWGVKGVGAILAFAILVGGFLWLFSKGMNYLTEHFNIKEQWKALVCVAGVIVLVAAMAWVFDYIVDISNKVKDWGNVVTVVGSMIGTMIAMGILVAVAGAIPKTLMKKGIVIMAAIELLMWGAAKAFEPIVDISKKIPDWGTLLETLAQMGVAMTAVGVFAGILGAIALAGGAVVLGAGGAVLAGIEGLMYGAAKVFLEIASVAKVIDEVKNADWKAAGKIITDFAVNIGKAFVTSMDEMPNPAKMWMFSKAISGISVMISDIAKAISDVSSLTIPMYDAKTGKQVGIRELKPEDFTNAATNTQTIVKTLGTAIIDIYKQSPEIFAWNPFGDTPFTRVVKSCTGLGNMISIISNAVKDVAELRVEKYDPVSGEVTKGKYRALKQEDFKEAAKHTQEIISTLGTAIITLYNQDKEIFEDPFIGDNPFTVVVKSATKLGKMISVIGNAVKEVADLRVSEFDNTGKVIGTRTLNKTDFKNAGKNVGNIITCLGTAILGIYDKHKELFDSNFSLSVGPFGLFGSIKIPTNADTPFAKVIKACTQMGQMISLISSGVASFASRFYFDLTTKQFKKLEDKDYEAASNHIKMVVKTLGQALVEVVQEAPYLFSYGQGSPILTATTGISKISETINTIAKTIAYYATGQFPSITYKDGKATTTLVEVFGKNGDETMFNSAKDKIQKVVRFLASTMMDLAKDKTLVEDNEDVDKLIASTQKMATTVNSISSTIKNMITNLANTELGGKNGIWAAQKKIKGFIDQMVILFTSESIKKFEINENLQKSLDWTNTYISSLLGTIKSNIELIQTEDIFGQLQDGLTRINNAVVAVINTEQGMSLDTKLGNWKAWYINKIVDTVRKAEESLDEDRFEQLAKGIGVLDQAINQVKYDMNFTHQAEDLDNYVEHINSLDMGKMQTFTSMVNALNQLSMRLGDLDHVSDVLANKVSVVLADLTNQIAHAETTINNSQILQQERAKLVDEKIQQIKSIMSQEFVIGVKQVMDNPSDDTVNLSGTGDGSATSVGGAGVGAGVGTSAGKSTQDPNWNKSAKAKGKNNTENMVLLGNIMHNDRVWGQITLYN